MILAAKTPAKCVAHDTPSVLADSRLLAFTASEKEQETETRKQDGR